MFFYKAYVFLRKEQNLLLNYNSCNISKIDADKSLRASTLACYSLIIQHPFII
jgi:hypothetical protein